MHHAFRYAHRSRSFTADFEFDVPVRTDHGIIHSYSGIGKVVEHGFDERWQKRVTAAYRYPYFTEPL
jgi:hypothetical protein